ncbi:MAG: hypothetical protein P8M11_08775 [Planctomycetota bacterium]|nr:hypothetical protein [Planctomycetota bacterium]MDG1984648.1 hypothetical protein [Planctomycetota bacterium]
MDRLSTSKALFAGGLTNNGTSAVVHIYDDLTGLWSVARPRVSRWYARHAG